MEGHRIQVEEETSNLWAANVMSVSTAVYIYIYIHAHVQCTLYIHKLYGTELHVHNYDVYGNICEYM